MKITIIMHSRVMSTFKWYGSIGFNSKGMYLYSSKKMDIEVAHILQEMQLKEFENFNFYEEEGTQKVIFDVDTSAKLEIHHT